MTMRRVTQALLCLTVLAGAAHAQREREPVRTEVRGVVKEVNADKGTITLTLPGGRGREGPAEKTFDLAKDVEVGIGGGGRQGFLRAGKVGELSTGSVATLILSPDQKQVDAVIGEGPTTRGVLRSVDAGKGTLTVALAPTRRDEAGEEKTYAVDENAEVGVDDGRGRRFSVKEGKLADLSAGAMVTLWLSPDQKKALAVLAEGP